MRVHAAVATLITTLALAACGDAPAPDGEPQSRAAPVRTAPAESAAITDAVRAVGILAPRDELRLSFKVGGVIETMAVESGDRVRAGQTLAVLKRTEVEAAVAQASEGVDKARRDLERARQLRADEVATQEQVEDLTTAYKVARSSLRAAEFNARFARIDAPADGVVLQRLARASELVQEGRTGSLVGIDDPQGLAQATARILALTPAERAALGTAARERVLGRFSVERMVDGLRAVYEEVA